MVRVGNRDVFNQTGKSEMVHGTIVATGFSVHSTGAVHGAYCKQALYKRFVSLCRWLLLVPQCE